MNSRPTAANPSTIILCCWNNSFSEQLKLNIEPNFVQIVAKSKDARTVGGLGDLETSVEYEFLRERRYRPALGVQGLIKWPTATDPDLGTPGHGYSLGLIATKDFVYFNADINLLYTFVARFRSSG